MELKKQLAALERKQKRTAQKKKKYLKQVALEIEELTSISALGHEITVSGHNIRFDYTKSKPSLKTILIWWDDPTLKNFKIHCGNVSYQLHSLLDGLEAYNKILATATLAELMQDIYDIMDIHIDEIIGLDKLYDQTHREIFSLKGEINLINRAAYRGIVEDHLKAGSWYADNSDKYGSVSYFYINSVEGSVEYTSFTKVDEGVENIKAWKSKKMKLSAFMYHLDKGNICPISPIALKPKK